MAERSGSTLRAVPGQRERAVIYARISMDRTGAGLGVKRQIDDCEQLIQERGWVLVDSFMDNDVSAYSGKPRPGYLALLEAMRAGTIDEVVAWHTDRLHRNPSELEEYIRVSEECRTATVTVRAGELDLSTAAGRMVARMLGAAARHESEQKSERVRRRRRQDAEAGRAHGPLGYGYDANQRIVPEQAEVIRMIADRLLCGASLYSIAVDLNARAVPTPGAGRWSHRQVTTLLRPDTVADETGSVADLRRVSGAVRSIIVAAVSGDKVDDHALVRLLNSASISDARGEAWTSRALGVPARVGPASDLIAALRADEAIAPGRVARALSAASVPAPRTTWRAANLRAMIRRGTLCGWRDFGPGARGGGDMVAKGSWDPILSLEESKKIRRILDAPERKRKGRDRRLLLSSILVCGRCGAPLSGFDSPRDGRRYSCASQPGLDRCGRLTVVAPPVEAAVIAAVFAALTDARFRRRQEVDANDRRVAAAEVELERIKTERDEYARDAAEGRIARSEWMILRDGLTDRILRAERTIGAGQRNPGAILKSVPDRREHLEDWWNSASMSKQREVLKILIKRVVVSPASHRGNQFDLNRLGSPEWRY